MAKTRLRDVDDVAPLKSLPGAALRAVLREGYSRAQFRQDLTAGFLVGIVALPLAMALAIAVGVPPQQGLYSAIVAGFLCALMGGSRIQVAGPTAAFIVVLAPVYTRFGLQGLLLSGLLAGLMLIGMGALRLGRFIAFIPFPVTTGFTTGIAVVIAGLQIKDFFGIRPDTTPEHFFHRLQGLWAARGTFSPWETAVALATLLILLVPKLPKRRLTRMPRRVRRLPTAFVALGSMALLAWALSAWFPGFQVETIGTRFQTLVGGTLVQGIPQVPPTWIWPWQVPGPGGTPAPITIQTINLLMPSAFAIAMLGAIESLLSAVVADGMARTRHDSDAELLALGVANVVTPFFGGIPATGAIARTAANFRFGGRSPVAAMTHALTILLAILLLAPLIRFLPMASLAALLLLVAWNMSEAEHFLYTIRVAPRRDVAVLLICFFLTVVFDMVVAVTVGVVLASLLFMRHMAAQARGAIAKPDHRALPGPLPPGVIIYDISGPLFFGAAERAMAAFRTLDEEVRAVILRMEQVPTADLTGLVAMDGVLHELERQRIKVLIIGLQPAVAELFKRAGLVAEADRLALCRDMTEAFRILNAKLHTYRRVAHGPLQFHVLHRRKAR